MNKLGLNIKKSANSNNSKKVSVEMDADRLEQLAANFGFFQDGFLKSVDKAEKDYQNGDVKKVDSLREIRNEK